MLEQFGGPQGELAAAMRYFTQALAEDDPGRKDMLLDIATEELSHLEIIGTIVAMLNKGVKGAARRRPLTEQAELYRTHERRRATTATSPAAVRRRPGADQFGRRAVDGRLYRHASASRPRPALQHRRRSARQDRLRAPDQHHRRSRRQGGARLPDDARDRAPEVIREGALLDRAEFPAGQTAGRCRNSPTCTSTCRRARATCAVRGTRASNGNSSTASRR